MKWCPRMRWCWYWHGMWLWFWSAVGSEELSQAERILRGQGGAGQGERPTQQQQLLGQSFGVILLRACQHLNGPQKKRWGYNPPRPPSNSCI